MLSKFKFGDRSLSYLNNSRLHPIVKDISNIALTETTLDFGVIDGVRTDSQQLQMYRKKVSELDGIKHKSDHQPSKFLDGLGRAIDFIPILNDNLDIWDINNDEVKVGWWEIIRAYTRATYLYNRKYKTSIYLELGVSYNLNGNSRDYPHISFKGI